MAQLTNKTTKWETSIYQDDLSQTYTFSTKDRYVDKDISLTVNLSETSPIVTNSTTEISTYLGSTMSLNTALANGQNYTNGDNPVGKYIVIKPGYISEPIAFECVIPQRSSTYNATLDGDIWYV